MIKAAYENNLKLAVVSQRRFFEPAMRVKRAIDADKIGMPVLGMVTMLGWRDEVYYNSDPWRGSYSGEGGGVLVNQAPHQLDLLLWYMGEAAEVFGCHTNFNHPYIEVEDTAVAVIRFKNGGLGSVVVSNSQNPALYGRVHIFGQNGSGVGVQTDGGAMFIAGMSSMTQPPKNDLWTIKGEEHLPDEWEKTDKEFFKKTDPMQYYHELQDRDFIDSVINDTKPMIDGYDAKRTVELFSAIYLSNKTGKPVKLIDQF
jgi:predicted dehydrogenase